MRRHVLATLALSLSFTLARSATAAPQKFETDGNHTLITFTASTVLFDVEGRFDKWNLAIEADPDALGPIKAKLDIDPKSVDTNNKTRDNHLRSPDFFDAEKYRHIVFTGTRASKEGDKIAVDGTLEMHGVTRPLRIVFAPVVAKNGAGVEEHVYKGEVVLNRKDFGIGADSVAAKISLADDVKVKLLIAGFFK